MSFFFYGKIKYFKFLPVKANCFNGKELAEFIGCVTKNEKARALQIAFLSLVIDVSNDTFVGHLSV